MYPVPDFSFFAFDGWIDTLSRPGLVRRSLLLTNGSHAGYEELFSGEDAGFWLQVHRDSGVAHDIFFPYPIGRVGLEELERHLSEFLTPLMDEITAKCEPLLGRGFGRTQTWMSQLFCDPGTSHYVAEHIAETIGFDKNRLPCFISWRDWEDYEVQLYELWKRADERKAILGYVRQTEPLFVESFKLPSSVRDFLVGEAQRFRDEFKDSVESILLELEPLASDQAATLDVRRDRVRQHLETKRSELLRFLGASGARLLRHGGEHDIYACPGQTRSMPIPRHPVVSVGVARKVREWAAGCGGA